MACLAGRTLFLGVSGRISRLFSLSADVRLNKRSFVQLPCDAAPSRQGAALALLLLLPLLGITSVPGQLFLLGTSGPGSCPVQTLILG